MTERGEQMELPLVNLSFRLDHPAAAEILEAAAAIVRRHQDRPPPDPLGLLLAGAAERSECGRVSDWSPGALVDLAAELGLALCFRNGAPLEGSHPGAARSLGLQLKPYLRKHHRRADGATYTVGTRHVDRGTIYRVRVWR